MKKLIYPNVIIVLTLVVAIILISVFFSSQNSMSGLAKTDDASFLQTSETTPEKSLSAQINPADIPLLKDYAESYEPKSTKRQVIPEAPELEGKVLQAVSNLSSSQSREHEKYVVLIFLRLYRFHIENFKQSYELGRDNFLTKEFFRLTGENDYQKAEFMPSYLASNYVEKNTELLKYPLIEKEMKRIEKAGEKIKKELEETEKRQKVASK